MVGYAAGVIALERWARVRLTVSPDGLRLRWCGRERAVPFSSIERIDPWPAGDYRGIPTAPEGFDVRLGSGEVIALYTAAERHRSGRHQRDVVLERVEETRAAPSSPGLRRRGRPGRASEMRVPRSTQRTRAVRA